MYMFQERISLSITFRYVTHRVHLLNDLTLSQLRDAELVTQVISLTGEKFANAGIEWQDLFANAIANAILGSLRS